MSNHRRARRRHARIASKVGAPPGTPIYVGVERSEPVRASVIDYDENAVRAVEVQETADLAAYPGTDTVTWINLDGVHQVEQVQALCRTFGVHPLWVEDIVNTRSRPKVDQIGEQVLVVARAIRPADDGTQAALDLEQVSVVMGPRWVLTFQERPGDVWGALRQRIRSGTGRVRRMKSDYLFYALLDSVVDHYFLALERIEERVDALEAVAFEAGAKLPLRDIFELKGELAEVRRSVWPMREVVAGLQRAEAEPISDALQPFLRDLYDHVVQVMDIIETSRERVVGVYELHIAVAGHRLNDIMKVLTAVSTVFIPMTFIAGVYGMNFEWMPELRWRWGYAFAWVLMLGSGGFGAGWMASRRWL